MKKSAARTRAARPSEASRRKNRLWGTSFMGSSLGKRTGKTNFFLKNVAGRDGHGHFAVGKSYEPNCPACHEPERRAPPRRVSKLGFQRAEAVLDAPIRRFMAAMPGGAIMATFHEPGSGTVHLACFGMHRLEALCHYTAAVHGPDACAPRKEAFHEPGSGTVHLACFGMHRLE